ncbi:TPA: YdaE family protein [Raoultella planticola]|uniref:YdaE family protein n=1 Tax=Raoultella planticola TaxID=575 RepID=UPI0039C40F3D
MVQKICAYCRKPIEEREEVKMTILIIHGAQQVRRERTYCSKRCGEYDAMANEA